MRGGFRYFTNAIVTSTEMNPVTGGRERTFKNVESGNWNTDANVTLNAPIRDGSRFTVSSTSSINYSHINEFINGDDNLNRNTVLTQRMGLNYRGELFDFSLRGNVTSDKTVNTIGRDPRQQFYRYGGTFNVRVFLPHRITLASDINYTATAGDLPAAFQINEWLWNASLQKTLFRNQNGTLAFNMHDILQQRRTIQRSITASHIRDSEVNTITSFFMVSFIYRFNIFRGGATRENMPMRGGGGGFDRGGTGGHGGGGERVIMQDGGRS